MADNFFYGLEGSNLFKIYVSDMALNGARIASNVYNEQKAKERARVTIVRLLMGHLGLSVWSVGSAASKKIVRTRQESEAKYDALSPGSSLFREGHKANFSLAGSDVQLATITPKPTGFKGAFSAGPTLELVVAGGKKRKFLLIENQSLTFVQNLLATVVLQVVLNP